MTETTWIVLIVAVAVVIAFLIYRNLKNFGIKANPDGVEAQFSTHPPQPGQTSTPAPSPGVTISGNKMFGWLQRIFVRRDQADVSNNVMAGVKQDIIAIPDSPLVTHLHQQLTNNFSVNDLRTLCVDLGQDYTALPGAGMENKTRALLAEFDKQQRLPQLIEAGRSIHPQLPWKTP